MVDEKIGKVTEGEKQKRKRKRKRKEKKRCSFMFLRFYVERA
jgi:hypothetical protein